MNGSSYQKTYRVRLKTVGPVFIGSGKDLSKKEYIFLENRTKIGVMDTEAFYMFLKKKGLSAQYEDFLLHEKRMDLYSWLRENNIKLQEIKPFLKYQIPMGDLTMERGRAKWEVKEGLKDPYGQPYVPGSSLKGMLRTILLSKHILDGKLNGQTVGAIRNASQEMRPRRNTFLLRESKRAEAELLHTLNRNEKRLEDAVNDSLSGLIIGDSDPLRPDDLVLCQKVDVHTDGTEKSLNLMRECIRPGTVISFTITIDSKLCGETKESLSSAIENFDGMYQKDFLDAFGDNGILPDRAVFIGGGSGFVSKTLVYPLFGKKDGIMFTQNVFDKTNVPREHKHNKDREYGVSPHVLKCTKIDGRLYQMGLCVLELE